MTEPRLVFAAIVAGVVLVAWHWWRAHRFHPPTDYGPDWPERRARYYRRHGCWCRICQTDDDIELHHRRGAGRRWRVGHEPDRALLAACHNCHMRIHARDDRFKVRFGFDGPLTLRFATWSCQVTGIWRRTLRKRPGR